MGMRGAINDQYRDIEGRLDVLTDGTHDMLPMLRPVNRQHEHRGVSRREPSAYPNVTLTVG